MAKIDTLKLDMGLEKDVEIPIYVNKEGIFEARPSHIVREKLNLQSTILKAKEKGPIVVHILEQWREWDKAATTEEIFIVIKFKFNGDFNKDSDGKPLYYNRSSSFSQRREWDDADSIAFDYQVLIKEERFGVIAWWKTRKGREDTPGFIQHNEDPNKYYQDGRLHGNPKGIIIPYSEESLVSLGKAREGLRQITEFLFMFLNRDAEEVAELLESGNLKLLN